jgi:hypothetical protein
LKVRAGKKIDLNFAAICVVLCCADCTLPLKISPHPLLKAFIDHIVGATARAVLFARSSTDAVEFLRDL